MPNFLPFNRRTSASLCSSPDDSISIQARARMLETFTPEMQCFHAGVLLSLDTVLNAQEALNGLVAIRDAAITRVIIDETTAKHLNLDSTYMIGVEDLASILRCCEMSIFERPTP